MKSIGIIVEYNPFHNGHKLHLDYARKQGDIVIGVMSGDFVQRGEPALINKWDRAKMALLEGLDIVVELPVFYSTQSAEIFARGSINILKELRSDEIVFGSESDNLDKLQEVIKLESNSNFIGNVKQNLKDGDSYPTAYNKEIKNYLGEEYEIKSNDILGIEYLRTIKTLKLDMKVKTLKREGKGYHSSISTGNILSATGIRKLLKEDKDIENFISKNSKEIILKNKKNKKLVDISHFYNLIRYAIISKREVLKDIQDIEVGFENRIYEMALKSFSYEIFMKNLMTKGNTIGRTQKILINILFSITKEDTIKLKKELPYIRILGFSDKGRTYLNKLKKEKKDDLENSNIQILTSLKNIKKKLSVEQLRYLELNEESSLIYRMINNYEDRKIPLMKRKDEYEIR